MKQIASPPFEWDFGSSDAPGKPRRLSDFESDWRPMPRLPKNARSLIIDYCIDDLNNATRTTEPSPDDIIEEHDDCKLQYDLQLNVATRVSAAKRFIGSLLGSSRAVEAEVREKLRRQSGVNRRPVKVVKNALGAIVYGGVNRKINPRLFKQYQCALLRWWPLQNQGQRFHIEALACTEWHEYAILRDVNEALLYFVDLPVIPKFKHIERVHREALQGQPGQSILERLPRFQFVLLVHRIFLSCALPADEIIITCYGKQGGYDRSGGQLCQLFRSQVFDANALQEKRGFSLTLDMRRSCASSSPPLPGMVL